MITSSDFLTQLTNIVCFFLPRHVVVHMPDVESYETRQISTNTTVCLYVCVKNKRKNEL